MKVLYCDVCKKVIENPIPTRTIYHVADVDICEPCKDELDVAIKSSVWGKKPFDYGWYDEVSLRVLRDGIQRGKISLPRR